MEKKDFEINLKDITLREHFLNADKYNNYMEVTGALLYFMKKFYVQGVTLDEFGEKTIDELAEIYPARYWTPGVVKIGKKEVKVWCDLMEDYPITPKDPGLYGRFLLLFLNTLTLINYDEFLDYHLETYYNDQTKKFLRFLNLTLREQNINILNDEKVSTIKEWIEEKQKEPEKEDQKKTKTKGKPKREPGDKRTVLSQEQTALLIHYLKEKKIIYREEYLTNKEAGEAFSVLTGYSADTIRQTLGKKELEKIATRKNLTDVRNNLQQIINQIDSELSAKKK